MAKRAPLQSKQTELLGSSELRGAAEKLILESVPLVPKATERKSQSLLHELQVHQVELEIQNEELRRSQLELEESRDAYAALFDLSPSAYLRLDAQFKISKVNLMAVDLLRENADTLMGKPFSRWISKNDADKFYLHCQEVRTSRMKQSCEVELLLIDGTSHTVQLATVHLDSSESKEASFLISIADLTEREKARALLHQLNIELETRVAQRTSDLATANLALQQHAIELKKLSRAVEQSRSLIILTDAGGIIEYTNPRFTELTAIPAEDVIGRRPTSENLGLAADWNYEHVWAAIHSGAEWRGTIASQDDRHESGWRDLCVSAIADELGRMTHCLVVGEDVTDRKAAEDRQQLLMAELNHRVNNTLSVVLSIARQTLRSSADLDAFRDSFVERLMALAQLHRLLTINNWGAVALEDLVDSVVQPYIDSAGPKVFVDGSTLKLDPMDAQSLHLVFHELATNSAKYGAFSVPGGSVKLVWNISSVTEQEMSLSLLWTEAGGPEVFEPTRRGFGNTLIERTIVDGWDGEIDRAYPSSGFCWKASIPVHVDGERISISNKQSRVKHV